MGNHENECNEAKYIYIYKSIHYVVRVSEEKCRLHYYSRKLNATSSVEYIVGKEWVEEKWYESKREYYRVDLMSQLMCTAVLHARDL